MGARRVTSWSRLSSRSLLGATLLALLAASCAQPTPGGAGSSSTAPAPADCVNAKAVGTLLRDMSASDPAYEELLAQYLEFARLCKKATRQAAGGVLPPAPTLGPGTTPSRTPGTTPTPSPSPFGPTPPGMGPSGARPSVPPGEAPMDALALLAKLPPAMQHAFLEKFGQDMVDRGAANCNVFGGQKACIPLSKVSVFAKTCVNHPLLVDCAFYDESLGQIDDDPTDDLRREVADQHEKPCEGCNTNLQELYCAQAVPACGTFQMHLEGAVLPALTKIVSYKETGQDYLSVVASVMPSLAKTTALTAPCRRYCEAITASCSCSQTRTFGQLLTALQAGGSGNAYLPALPPAAQQVLFSQLMDVPLCELYADENDPGFSGHCPAEGTLDLTQCAWCTDDDGVPTFVQEYLADSLLNGLFGWLIGPEGLLAEADIFSGDNHDEDDVNPDDGYVMGGGGGGGGG
eukprot:CAMPEP_0197583178 /NCGR_PEP_ID=MMETSP1326-20131121/6172_1 /TAXON_ID=1155430 /ORGANISM="Genus nov. species nov., Strain RCC2288" /LENGTH=460 /DNA_ID=CAMNT_0043147359 /DNA_START=185 /DNA_END=1563 /DNA_ORIENTATION=-